MRGVNISREPVRGLTEIFYILLQAGFRAWDIQAIMISISIPEDSLS